MLRGIWTKLTGWKTTIGAVITIVAYIVGGIPLLAPFFGVATVAQWAGVGVMVVGLLHKGYRFLFGQEHE